MGLSYEGVPVLALDSTKHDADFLTERIVTAIQALPSLGHH